MDISGALAWRPDVAMTQDEIDDFLSGRWVARLSTNGRDGYPHIAPLWYYWDGESMYFALTTNRRSYKNLHRDPRCAVVIDMDDRPLMGMRSNLAKAVLIIGEAHMTMADANHTVVIGAGPWQGEYTAQAAVALLTNRYGLFARDGALGMTREAFRSLLVQPDLQDSQIAKDNAGRVFTRVVPKRIQAWDFSKAPIGRPPSS